MYDDFNIPKYLRDFVGTIDILSTTNHTDARERARRITGFRIQRIYTEVLLNSKKELDDYDYLQCTHHLRAYCERLLQSKEIVMYEIGVKDKSLVLRINTRTGEINNRPPEEITIPMYLFTTSAELALYRDNLYTGEMV